MVELFFLLFAEVVELCSSSIPTQQSSSKLGFAFAAPSVDTCFPEKVVIFLKKLTPSRGYFAFGKNCFLSTSLEVHPDSICFFNNGTMTLTYPRTGQPHQFPWPDYPFHIILSNQLGGAWTGAVDKPEPLPSELRVDWIKVYQKR